MNPKSDLNQYYKKYEFYGLSNHPAYVILVSAHLLSTIAEVAKETLTPIGQATAKKPILPKLKILTKKFNAIVLIVDPPNWVPRGLFIDRNKQERVKNCTEKFFELCQMNVKDFVCEREKNVTVTVQKSSQASLSIQMERNKLFCVRPNHETNWGSVAKSIKILENYKEQLMLLVNHCGAVVYPNQSIFLLWDLLSQSILEKHPMDDEEKRRSLSYALIHRWMQIQTSFSFFLEACRHFDVNCEGINCYINRIQQMLNTQIMDGIDPELAEKLKQVELPFKNIIDYLLTLSSKEDIKYFLTQFTPIHGGRLRNVENFSLHLHFERESHKQSIEFRINLLKKYLIQSCISPISPEDKSRLIKYCEEIESFFKEHQWIVAYYKLLELVGLLKKVSEYFQEQLNRPTDSPAITSPISELQEDSSANSEKELRLRYNISLYAANHYHTFGFDLLSDFGFLVSNNKLLSVISHEAKDEMIKNFETMAIPIAKRSQNPLDKWLQDIIPMGGPDYKQNLSDFRNSWKALRKIQKQLIKDTEFTSLIQQLQEKIEKKDYQHLQTTYLLIAIRLKEPIQAWEEQLKRISSLVEGIQLTAIILFYNPSIPPIDAKVIKEGFSQFNAHLLRVVQPITQFINAFQQLICFDDPSSSSLPSSSSSPQLLFTNEGKTFSLTLFSEEEEYFEKLSTWSSKDKLDNEVQEPSITSSSAPAIVPMAEIVAEVKKIFGATKSEKIEAEFFPFLDSHGIRYRIETGKGSHTKLFIGSSGVPIILPHHKEWKPGTKKSVENSLLEQLKVILEQSAASSSHLE
ncbi:MAG: hypothetical protein ACHQUC_02250 [Chlamydiales bacterium]